ncbi:hypothetical protein [Streptomyces sp. WAC 01529]|nr:hypothetical protein [Streptomyces sp. WAC 01529]
MAEKPSAYEYARLCGINVMAVIRGDLTDRQKRALERLEKRAAKREAGK